MPPRKLTPDQARKNILRAVEMYKAAVWCLIIDELKPHLEYLSEQTDKAAAALRERIADLEGPEQDIRDIQGQIEHGEAKIQEWVSRAESGDSDEKVQARVWISVWEIEIDSLRYKKQQAEEDLAPYIVAKQKASQDLAAVQGARTALLESMLAPNLGLGKGTSAYAAFRKYDRLGISLVDVLMKNDRSDPEWDTAWGLLLDICAVVKLKASELPPENTAVYTEAINPTPAPSPTAADLMADAALAMKTITAGESTSDHPIPHPARWHPVNRPEFVVPHTSVQVRGRQLHRLQPGAVARCHTALSSRLANVPPVTAASGAGGT
jgi:hypothetical protein